MYSLSTPRDRAMTPRDARAVTPRGRVLPSSTAPPRFDTTTPRGVLAGATAAVAPKVPVNRSLFYPNGPITAKHTKNREWLVKESAWSKSGAPTTEERNQKGVDVPALFDTKNPARLAGRAIVELRRDLRCDLGGKSTAVTTLLEPNLEPARNRRQKEAEKAFQDVDLDELWQHVAHTSDHSKCDLRKKAIGDLCKHRSTDPPPPRPSPQQPAGSWQDVTELPSDMPPAQQGTAVSSSQAVPASEGQAPAVASPSQQATQLPSSAQGAGSPQSVPPASSSPQAAPCSEQAASTSPAVPGQQAVPEAAPPAATAPSQPAGAGPTPSASPPAEHTFVLPGA